jgi:hypothetical protein
MNTAANNAHVPNSLLHAMKGLAMARQVTIRPGQILYRFVDISRAPGPIPAANGPWWFEYEAFQQIKHFGSQHKYSLEYSARLFAAILYEWSEVTGYVRAEVLQPLEVWKGRGRQVEAKGGDSRDLATMTPMQSINEVYQLFIPGVHSGTKLFPSAFKFIEYVPARPPR